MNALIWNVRSVNTKKAFKRLLTMHNRYSFFLIGLMEHFQKPYKLESYRMRLGLETALHNVNNKIWAFLDESWKVTILIDSEQHLTLRLSNLEVDTEMIVTLVYAKCDRVDRIELSDAMDYLENDMTRPWLVAGDFNVVTDENEKYGGNPVSLNEVEYFRHCITTCLEITYLIKNGLDYSPLLVELKQQVQHFKKPFKFLNLWVKHETFLEVVQANWETDMNVNSFYVFNSKLKNLKKVLTAWSRSTYGDIFQQITNMKGVIKAHETIFEADPSYANKEKLNKAQFHEVTPPVQFDILEHIPRLFTVEQNEALVARPTKEEVKNAVFGLNSASAAGPDGFTGLFFQTCWEIVGNDIFNMVGDFIHGSELPRVTHERLATFLSDLISHNQAGFVRGRSIVENILLTQEIITDIRLRTNKGKKNVLINGQAHGFFYSTRGVKQGDLLSSTLFILAAVALSRALNVLHENPWFCACEISLKLIMDVLKNYEAASGQLINKAKSSSYLHDRVDEDVFLKVERWNFRTKPTLWGAFMSNKYLKKNNPILVPWKKGSYIWRKMLEARDLIDHEIWWQLRMGSSFFLFDNWTGLSPLWNEAVIRNSLPEEHAEFILTEELWKKINGDKHDNKVTDERVIYQASTLIQQLVKLRKPCIQKVPHRWPEILHILESFVPKLKVTKVVWSFPMESAWKCNADGATRGNPGRSSFAFCVRDHKGDLVHAFAKEMEESTNTELEARALLKAARY
ncbi:uncharacterized protein LOC132607916 [Lycium barbarum]|uniref:uncharacterized protein LOC132607916 n=1 Tax=Lycium barbarum TaxID=112863 RepID=UPI00293EC540|nr:uncharacterized protein LOC132607916 [Lycium barbarum]